MSQVQVTWLPIIDDAGASQMIAESDGPFAVVVKSEAGDVRIESAHDGLVHFVSVDVSLNADADVEVTL